MSDFGLFEASVSSEAEAEREAREASARLAAAIVDVRTEFGPFLFAASDIQDFRDRVALCKREAMKVIDRNVPPVTGVVRRIIGKNGALESEFRQRLADTSSAGDIGGIGGMTDQTATSLGDPGIGGADLTPGAAGSGAVSAPSGGISGMGGGATPGNVGAGQNSPLLARRRQSDKTGPDMDNKVTVKFQDPDSGNALKPKDDWKGYLKGVSQGAEGKVDKLFTNKSSTESDFVPGGSGPNFVPGSVNKKSRRTTACWPGCHENEAHAAKFHKDEAKEKEARRRTSADHLQKAHDSLVNVLNEHAQNFQKGVQPLQQALMTIQQQLQMQSPLAVQPPAGTINVMPQGTAPGAMDAGAQGMGTGLPTPQPMPMQQAASRRQAEFPPKKQKNHVQDDNADAYSGDGGDCGTTARRRRASDPRARSDDNYASSRDRGRAEHERQDLEEDDPRYHTAGVSELWDAWQKRRAQGGQLGVGGQKDIEDFANEKKIGPRARKSLETSQGLTSFAGREGKQGRPFAGSRKQAWSGWGHMVAEPTRKVAGWDWDDHLNGYISPTARRFACSCGKNFDTPSGFQRCACGKQWNSYVIGNDGRTASADKFIVREIPRRENVIVAGRQAVNTRGMDPNSHAYHKDNPKRVPSPNPRFEPDGYEENYHSGEAEDDESGYNWGPEPRRHATWSQTADGWSHTNGNQVRPAGGGNYQLHVPAASMGGPASAKMYAPGPDPQALMQQADSMGDVPSLAQKFKTMWQNRPKNGGFAGGRSAGYMDYGHPGGSNVALDLTLGKQPQGPRPPSPTHDAEGNPIDWGALWRAKGERDQQSLKGQEAWRRQNKPTLREKAHDFIMGPPTTAARHDVTTPGECMDEDGEDDGTCTFRKMPSDWAKRDNGGRWVR